MNKISSIYYIPIKNDNVAEYIYSFYLNMIHNIMIRSNM